MCLSFVLVTSKYVIFLTKHNQKFIAYIVNAKMMHISGQTMLIQIFSTVLSEKLQYM